MNYTVSHRTTFDYAQRVSISHHLLHLEARDVPFQTVSGQAVLIEPAPAVQQESIDYFGNPTRHLTIQEAHDQLTILSTMSVDVAMPPMIHAEATPAWESVYNTLNRGDCEADLKALEYCFPSSLAPTSQTVGQYTRESFPTGRPILVGAEDLMRRIYMDFSYEGGVTDISTPIDTVLKTRTGVCQDFAHLMIGGLRILGLPARYVSGYIRTIPPEGEDRLVGADASHAWVSIYAPNFGWTDLDPTNNKRRSEDHITLAWGRDYSDVSPINGLIVGGGEHDIKVEVDVKPEKDA